MFKKKALVWVLGAALCGAVSLPVQAQVLPPVLQELVRKAEQGDAEAQVSLGMRYNYGTGVPQDAKQAAQWYHKAAEQGDAYAQATLGFRYYKGEGVPQSYKHSYAWFSVSFANGLGAAKEYRDNAVQKLSPSELSEAQALAAEYIKKY